MTTYTLYGSFTSPYVRHCRIALLETALLCHFSEADTQVSAKLSPMQKVPFLVYQENGRENIISDSAAILKLIREQAGASFLVNVSEFNNFCAANTLLDTALNLFFLEKDAITEQQSPYLQRQKNRIQTALAEFEKQSLAKGAPYNDFELRLACALDWGLFRNRFSLTDFPRLQTFLTGVNQYPYFFNTKPPLNA